MDGEVRGFVGHLDAAGRFVSDTPFGIALDRHRRASLIDFRVPVSSNCTADPFTADGATCAPADVNAPFFTFTAAGSPQRLFAQAAIGGPNCVIFARCHVVVHVHHRLARIVALLRQRHGVGILVQRVHGHHLERVGKVPLGTHGKGRLRLRWNLRVNGKPLHPGRYQITLRALDGHKRVLGLSAPTTIRVRR